MPDCIFCKIANGEVGVPFVYEDEHVVAFDDISPQAPVHTLIVPKVHFATLLDAPSDEVLGHIWGAAAEVARRKGVADSGFRTIQNNGDDAGQTVHHLHVHILGGRSFGEGMV